MMKISFEAYHMIIHLWVNIFQFSTSLFVSFDIGMFVDIQLMFLSLVAHQLSPDH